MKNQKGKEEDKKPNEQVNPVFRGFLNGLIKLNGGGNDGKSAMA